jgi:K+-dependent Na+/Ca+ exchanger-like protein
MVAAGAAGQEVLLQQPLLQSSHRSFTFPPRAADSVANLSSSSVSESKEDTKSSSSLTGLLSEVVAQSPTLPPTGLVAYCWWFLIFYMFYIMSVICDDYLVPTIDVICAKFQIPEDVAGATLMAFACNGPELLTNVSAIFVTDSSVGMGCIVGSAIFNVLVIVGACPIFAPGGKLDIPVQTFVRDAIFSAISIFILLWALPDVTLLHASILLVMAFVYVFVVYKTKSWFGTYEVSGSNVQESLLENSCDPFPSNESEPSEDNEVKHVCGVELPKHTRATPLPRKLLNWCWTTLSFPTKALMWATIPDVRRDRSKHLYIVAFFTSMLWLSTTSYVVVIAAKYINKYWGISESFLGLTLISIGTSWPNLIASVITAQQGRGAMAVGNALGSNVQNVFLVLALPIWVYCLRNGSYHMSSKDINSSIIWMAATLGVVFTLTVCNKFKLVQCSGFSFFAAYLAYLVYATIIQ